METKEERESPRHSSQLNVINICYCYCPHGIPDLLYTSAAYIAGVSSNTYIQIHTHTLNRQEYSPNI